MHKIDGASKGPAHMSPSLSPLTTPSSPPQNARPMQHYQAQRLRRTTSQSSFSSVNSALQVPRPAQPLSEGASLNQQGQIRCIQSLTQASPHSSGDSQAATDSVLSVEQSSEFIFSGSQSGSIYVWDKDTYQLVTVLKGAHTAGCHSLAMDRTRNVLFSGGGDGVVKAWRIDGLECDYVVYAGVNAGGVLALVYVEQLDLLVLGCQNTSIQWFSVANRDDVPEEAREAEMAARRSRFFDDDSADSACGSMVVVTADTPHASAASQGAAESPDKWYVIFDDSIVPYAHSGYVCALTVGGGLPGSCGDLVLLSGASDGLVKLWRLGSAALVELGELARDPDVDNCVHSLAITDDLLYTGMQSGEIEVWDLETRQMVRVLAGHRGNVFTLAVHLGLVYSGSADGTIRVWCADFQCVGWISSAADSVLCLAVSDDDVLVSGSSSNEVAFWDIALVDQHPAAEPAAPPLVGPRRRRGRRMLNALDQWIRLRSVSGVPELQPECRRAAKFLRDLMRQLGADDARLISSLPTSNPLVYGRFDASGSRGSALESAPTIFVYGHYDVMPAGDESLWRTSPFELVGKDGYLYGRGVTDDKGPVLATLFAVAELAGAGELPVAVVFCIEGEEEHGSVGLREALAGHRELFGIPQMILLSSSYWIGENTPCLTYGMRGSIRANIRVESSRKADVHAGVWGGAVNEPLACLSHVIARLVDPSGNVLVPGFSDDVVEVSEAEAGHMRGLVEWILAKEAETPLVARAMLASSSSPSGSVDSGSAPLASGEAWAQDELYSQLMHRWRFPTLTVHHVDVSTGAARSNATLIPAAAQAVLSVRVVPNQSLEDIAGKLRSHVESVFDEVVGSERKMDTLKLHLDVHPNAHWWLAKPESAVYKAAAKAIEDEWGKKPLLIREGGSIPAVPWLEQFFAHGAVAVNLPMGQASDNAHLDNERIMLVNLMRGRQVVWRLVKDFVHA